MQAALYNMKSEQKRVTISSKRQFTIPQKFFSELGFDREAICTIQDGKLIVIPASHLSGGEFAEQILAELIAEGLSGEELLNEFKVRQSKVRSSVDSMLDDAQKVAEGNTDYMSYNDVFGTED